MQHRFNPISHPISKIIDYYVLSEKVTCLGHDAIDFERREYGIILGLKVLAGLKCEEMESTLSQQFANINDGYRMLKTLMELHLSQQLRESHTPSAYIYQTQRPTFPHNSQIFVYQNDLSLYYQTKRAYDREYTEVEKISAFLGEMTKDSILSKAIDEAKKNIPREITRQVLLETE